jgi:hypothetical protein
MLKALVGSLAPWDRLRGRDFNQRGGEKTLKSSKTGFRIPTFLIIKNSSLAFFLLTGPPIFLCA